MVMMTAQNVMTDAVISVSPELTLLGLLRIFVDENIHGAPVVDEDERPIGVITTTDLLRAQEVEHDSAWATSDYLRGVLEFSSPDWSGDLSDFQDRLAQRTVAEFMTTGLVSVPLDAPVSDIARCLRKNQIHRVWVEDEGRLCGVISALDLMPVIERGSDTG